MANFELRIYTIPYNVYCDKVKELNADELSENEFVELVEENGDVYTLASFFGLDVFDFDENVVRAYFIDKDNEDIPPIPADHYNTVITSSLIRQNDRIVYDENNVSSYKVYTIIVTNNDKDTSTQDILDMIEELDDVLDVELLAEVNDTRLRIQVKTQSYFDYDVLEGTIDSCLGLDCEFLTREDY